MQDRIKTVLSSLTRQSIATMVMNFVSTIPDGEEIEMAFSHVEEDGNSHIYLDATRKSRTPDIQKTVILTHNSLDVKCNSKSNGKSKDKADNNAT